MALEKKNFLNNTFEFESGGRSYLFLTPRVQLFPVDEDTTAVLKKIREYPETRVPIDFLVNSSSFPDKAFLREWLKEFEHQLDFNGQSCPISVNINNFSLTLTGACNLNCHYCYQRDLPLSKNNLSFKTIKDILHRFTSSVKSPGIVFYGGEALLAWPLVKKTVLYCSENFPETTFKYSIFTNGTLLTPAKIDFLIDHNFEIILGIDGPPDIMHGSQATPTSHFDSLEKTVRYLTSNALPKKVRTHTVIHQHNINLPELINYFKSLGLKFFSFAPATSPDQNKMNALIRSWRSHFADFAIDSKNHEALEHIVEINYYLQKIRDGKALNSFCGAGRDYLSVNSEGEFYLCHRFENIPAYRVGSTTDGIETEKIISHLAAPLNDSCKSCWARSLCAGGCKKQSLSVGDTLVPNPEYCALIKTYIRTALHLFVAQL